MGPPELALLLGFLITQSAGGKTKASNLSLGVLDDMRDEMTKLNKVFENAHARLTQKVIADMRSIHPGDSTGNRTWVVLVGVGDRKYYMYKQPQIMAYGENFPAVEHLKPLLKQVIPIACDVTSAQLTYDDALTWCRERGLSLLSVENEAASLALEKAVPLDDTDMYFTSGNDLSNLFYFVWKTSGQAFTFSNFFPDDPNNLGEGERCVTAGRHYGNKVGWFDQSCVLPRGFICEKL